MILVNFSRSQNKTRSHEGWKRSCREEKGYEGIGGEKEKFGIGLKECIIYLQEIVKQKISE